MPCGRPWFRPVFTTGTGREMCRFCRCVLDPRLKSPRRRVFDLSSQPNDPLLLHGAQVYGKRAEAVGSTCVCEACSKGHGKPATENGRRRPVAKRSRTQDRVYMGFSSRISSDEAKYPVHDLGETTSPVGLLYCQGEDPRKYVRARLFRPSRATIQDSVPDLDKGGEETEVWPAAIFASTQMAREFMEMQGAPLNSKPVADETGGGLTVSQRLDNDELIPVECTGTCAPPSVRCPHPQPLTIEPPAAAACGICRPAPATSVNLGRPRASPCARATGDLHEVEEFWNRAAGGGWEQTNPAVVRGRMKPLAIAKSKSLTRKLITRPSRFADNFYAHEPSARARLRVAAGPSAKVSEWWMDPKFQKSFPYVILGRDWEQHHQLPERVHKIRKCEHTSTLTTATFRPVGDADHDASEEGDVAGAGAAAGGVATRAHTRARR